MNQIRRVVFCATASLFAACGGPQEDIACCAIEPKARCKGELLGVGLTDGEVNLLTGLARPICPGPALSEDRLREIEALWPDSCLTTRPNILAELDTGVCSGEAR